MERTNVLLQDFTCLAPITFTDFVGYAIGGQGKYPVSLWETSSEKGTVFHDGLQRFFPQNICKIIFDDSQSCVLVQDANLNISILDTERYLLNIFC
jgi:hypothetical protein